LISRMASLPTLERSTLLSVVPIQEMYVNANFKEVQLKDVQPGQEVELTSDLHGEKVVYHGVIDGFSPKGVEGADDVAWRKSFLRQIGYKL